MLRCHLCRKKKRQRRRIQGAVKLSMDKNWQITRRRWLRDKLSALTFQAHTRSLSRSWVVLWKANKLFKEVVDAEASPVARMRRRRRIRPESRRATLDRISSNANYWLEAPLGHNATTQPWWTHASIFVILNLPLTLLLRIDREIFHTLMCAISNPKQTAFLAAFVRLWLMPPRSKMAILWTLM